VRYAAIFAVMTVVFVAGCNNSPGDDPANMTKAPPAAPGAQGLTPNMNKKMPGSVGAPGTMGGGSAPAAGGMSSTPAAKPAGQ